MDIVKVFGTNLKNYRTQKGLSQEKFAEKCGLHRTYISDRVFQEKYLSGEYSAHC